MNLVAKEFVAARDDEQGVLILSQFAGAARELTEALIVNPYDVEEVADALQRALTMPADEQRERMASLRMTVREFNVYPLGRAHAARRGTAPATRAHCRADRRGSRRSRHEPSTRPPERGRDPRGRGANGSRLAGRRATPWLHQ